MPQSPQQTAEIFRPWLSRLWFCSLIHLLRLNTPVLPSACCCSSNIVSPFNTVDRLLQVRDGIIDLREPLAAITSESSRWSANRNSGRDKKGNLRRQEQGSQVLNVRPM
ncbi:hypothetical protein N656DRAFT_780214 [Canariomyces notabilis]|uniref:Uncharacterized protein n=1 Tax=Canariomyces notabilis TaxID=2074819 RepID=A0AAN6YQ83_9PEZI|nr:hypothetical protein N656DRAFT_780214 [Canariomyces arenarius]